MFIGFTEGKTRRVVNLDAVSNIWFQEDGSLQINMRNSGDSRAPLFTVRDEDDVAEIADAIETTNIIARRRAGVEVEQD